MKAIEGAGHAKALLKAQVNKTGRNDARSVMQMMCVNLFGRSISRRWLARSCASC
jgi:hypothetical protein